MFKDNKKIYVWIGAIFLVIVIMWVYTLRLNLSQESEESSFSFTEIFKEIKDSIKPLPKLPENEVVSEVDDQVADKIVGEIKEKLEEKIDTTNWLAYVDEEFGYTFKYPSDWNVFEYSDQNIIGHKLGIRFEDQEVFKVVEIKNTPKDTTPFCTSGGPGEPIEGFMYRVIISKKDENTSFEKEFELCRGETEDCDFFYREIDSREALVITDRYHLCGFYPESFVFNGDYYYQIYSTWYNGSETDMELMSNQYFNYLDTFSFTEQ